MVKALKKEVDIDAISNIEDLKKINLSFEQAYSKLEEIVSLQEGDALNLEDSIKYYRIGKILVTYCQEILDNAKVEIERISE